MLCSGARLSSVANFLSCFCRTIRLPIGSWWYLLLLHIPESILKCNKQDPDSQHALQNVLTTGEM